MYVDIDNTLNLAYKRFRTTFSADLGRHISDPYEPTLVLADEAIEYAEDALHLLQSAGYRIVYLTARCFVAAVEVTHAWLFAQNSFPKSSVIFTCSAEEKIAFLQSSSKTRRQFTRPSTSEVNLDSDSFELAEFFGPGRENRMLIDDLTRSHHQQVFEPQTDLLRLLDANRFPYIRFNTFRGSEMWKTIVRKLLPR